MNQALISSVSKCIHQMLIGITYRSVHIHIYIYIGEPSGNSFPFNLKENRKSPLHSYIHYPKLSWKYPQKCCRQMEITWRSAFTTLQAASQYLCRQFTMKQFESKKRKDFHQNISYYDKEMCEIQSLAH